MRNADLRKPISGNHVFSTKSSGNHILQLFVSTQRVLEVLINLTLCPSLCSPALISLPNMSLLNNAVKCLRTFNYFRGGSLLQAIVSVAASQFQNQLVKGIR